MRTFGVSDDDDDDGRGGRRQGCAGGGVDTPQLHARRRHALDDHARGDGDRAGVRLPDPDRPVPAPRSRPGRRGRLRDHHGLRLGDLQARRDGHLVRGPRAHLRADRRRSPGLQPDRHRRHPLGRRRGQGGDHRADDRHHAGHRDLHRADLVELRARLLVQRAEADPQARRDPGADRIVDVGRSRTPTRSSSPGSSTTRRSASTTSPRGPGSWSPSCPRASGWRCGRSARRPSTRRSGERVRDGGRQRPAARLLLADSP